MIKQAPFSEKMKVVEAIRRGERGIGVPHPTKKEVEEDAKNMKHNEAAHEYAKTKTNDPKKYIKHMDKFLKEHEQSHWG